MNRQMLHLPLRVLESRRRPALAAAVWLSLLGAAGLTVPCLAAPAMIPDGEETACDVTAQAVRIASQRTVDGTEARQFLMNLDLSRTQAKRLIPILEKVADHIMWRHESESALFPEMVEAFSAFAEEDRLNQGFTPEVEQRTARANNRYRDAAEQLITQLMVLESEASDLLSAQQRRYAGIERLATGQPTGAGDVRLNERDRIRPMDDRRKAEAIRRDLNAINHEVHPRLSSLGRHLFDPAVFEDVCRIAGQDMPDRMARALDVHRNGTESYPMSLRDQHDAHIACLRTEINNWNLINGLHLNLEQSQQILAAYERALRDQRWETGAWATTVNDLPRAALYALERDVEAAMTPGQKEVLGTYKACLIPPKNLKDPVRIGQAGNSSRYEVWLARSRTMPRDQWSDQADTLIDREQEHGGTLNPRDRQKRKMLLVNAVRRSAAMTDAEFELSKADLAESIMLPDRQLDLRAEIEQLADVHEQPGLTARFMINPDFMSQLRTRAEQLAAGYTADPTDLAAGPQAENCEDGCAINTDNH